MPEYTDGLREQPVEWLKALSICLGGTWGENEDTVGFTVSHDGYATDVEFETNTDTVLVTNHGITITRWAAPLGTCELTQRPDDGQLFTELASSAGVDSDTTSHSLCTWGPRARYRGGGVKLAEPGVHESEFILCQIVDQL